MARGMKAWVVAVSLGCLVALGLASLWSSSLRRSVAGPPLDAEKRAYSDLAREATRTATAIQRIRWVDTIRSRAAAGDSLVVLGRATAVPPEVRAVVAEARRGLEPGAVAVAIVPARFARPPDGSRYPPRGGTYGIDYLLAEGGRCQVAAYVPGGPSTAHLLSTSLRPDRLLGPCAWVARFGPPGDSVRAWLRAGGGWAAMAAEPSSAGRRPTEDEAGYGLDHRERACVRGDATACLLALQDPAYPTRPAAYAPLPDDPVLFETGGRLFASVGAHFLADVEAEIGPERFARFWRSRRPPMVALSDALGRPAGEWIAEWAGARFLPPARLGVTRLDVLLALLTGAVFLGIAVIAGARGARRPASARHTGQSAVTNPDAHTS